MLLQRTAVVGAVAVFLCCCCTAGTDGLAGAYTVNTFVTNEAFIEGLYSSVELDDALSVFQRVYRSLSSEVTVYPTENYYYFLCTIDGVALRGAIGLFADRRDDGFLSFSYEQVTAGARAGRAPLIAVDVELSERDGVRITKVTDTRYVVEFDGRPVVFVLRGVPDVAVQAPLRSPDELLLGATFDESGLQFYLVYNKKCSSFFWMLREDQFVPEEFEPYAAGLTVGRRTAYVFYADLPYHRKLLLGVSAANVAQNNWYDGPFDQLPDDAIRRGELNLQEYIEAAYPWTRGRIDEYGVFRGNREMRVAIAPYIEYANLRAVRKLVVPLRAGRISDFYCALGNRLRHEAAAREGRDFSVLTN